MVVAAPEQVEEHLPPVIEMTPEESREWYEGLVEEILGMSANEFLARLDAGEYDAVIDEPPWDILYLAMLGDSVAPR